MVSNQLTYTNQRLSLVFHSDGDRMRLETLSADGTAWLHPQQPSPFFAVEVDGVRLDLLNLSIDHIHEEVSLPGNRHIVFTFREMGLQIEQHLKLYGDEALFEANIVICNQSQSSVTVNRVDSIVLNLPPEGMELLSFKGDWGSEFEPSQAPLSNEVVLESRSGRSSKGNHPWFALTRKSGPVLSGAPAWSGNWVFRFQPVPENTYVLSGGLHDWQFSKELQPGKIMEAVPVILALGSNLNDVSQQYARVGRRYWYPHNELSSRLPVEWNHWWSYEDVDLNENVFEANVDQAEKLGFEICTLDAGWFGPADPRAHWYEYRGDWMLINEGRFPKGIAPISENTHQHHMKFGLWCEIEGLGIHARLSIDHPEYAAQRNGENLGYVCFGNPRVEDWAYQTLAGLITAYNCDWIKLDFNVDPGAGCNCSDHGHGVGDGLFEHYRGYYRMLERIRRNFPDVVLENCSSGGLRIDLGIMRSTHLTFLSDPDWAVHDLQIFWGASTMLAPNVLLHWTISDWRMENPPQPQNFDPHDPRLTPKKWDYYNRIAMLGANGMSQKLPDLPPWLAMRIQKNNSIYQTVVRRFIRKADLYRLTGQPRRNGEGDRWCAFQYSLCDHSEHLLFVFRLPGAEKERAICLENLDPQRLYTIQGLEGEPAFQQSGKRLTEAGLLFTDLAEEDSVLLKIS